MHRQSIIVTGASGLLGQQVVRDLHADWDVHAVVRRAPSVPLPGVRYHEMDLASHWDPTVLPSRVQAVMHLAQSSHFRDFPEKALDIFQVNVASTGRLLDYAHRAGSARFLYASSGGVYGAGNEPFAESAPYAPAAELGYYLSSKINGEVLAQNYAALMKVVILRFFFIYGAAQNRTMLIPRLIDNISAGRPVNLQGDDGLRLNPIHVSDASRATVRALSLEGGGTFNVAGSQVVTLRELCREIELVVGQPACFQRLEGEPKDAVANIDAMRRCLCAPSFPLSAGLRDVLK